MSNKVLVVDDEVDILEAIKIILEGQGLEVKMLNIFKNTKEIEDFMPGLILLDMAVGGQKGEEIAKRINANSKTSHIPIVVLSAKPLPNLRYLAKESGAVGFLQKPFEMSDLISIVKNNLKN